MRKLYPGIAKLVSRLVWERGAHRRFSRTASPEPLAITAFLVFPVSRKIPFDHMFDHSCAELKISYPGVVQLIERAVWERGAQRRFSRTSSPEVLAITAFFVFRFFAKFLLTTCLTIVAQNSKFHIRV